MRGDTALRRRVCTAQRVQSRSRLQRFAKDADLIGLPHDERPRLDTADRKSDRNPVNETKSALFLLQGNDRLARDPTAERFAIVTARPAISTASRTTKSDRMTRGSTSIYAVSRARARSRLRWMAISRGSCWPATQQSKFISSPELTLTSQPIDGFLFASSSYAIAPNSSDF